MRSLSPDTGQRFVARSCDRARPSPHLRRTNDGALFLSSYMKSSYVIGIGCRRDVSVEQIDAAVRAALGSTPFSKIRAIASIDIKRDEPALNEFARRHGLPLNFFSPGDIVGLNVPAPSPHVQGHAQGHVQGHLQGHVQAHLGVDGVCEPCALLASNNGKLIVAKRVLDGVTVAIAQDDPATSGQTHENG